MLNVESGDYAQIGERDCGCLLERIGLRTHISGIRSYEKLTSEGVTFMGSRLYDLVESVLPDRFGGTIGDYQIVEQEEDGMPRVSVLVSPSVGRVDNEALIATVLDNLKATHREGGELMTEQWRQAGTLRVLRGEPYKTRSEKVMPLHVIRKDGAAASRAMTETAVD
jgi:hypothetical protein